MWFFSRKSALEVNREVRNLPPPPVTVSAWSDIRPSIYDVGSDEIPVVAACISAIATPIAAADIKGNTTIIRALQTQWPSVVRHLTAKYFITGIGYVAISPWPIMADSQTIILPSTSTVQNGTLTFAGVTYPKESVICIYNPSPNSRMGVDAPLNPVRQEIATWYALAAWRVKLLRRLPAMVGIVTVPTNMSPAKTKELGQAIDAVLGLSERSTIVIDGGGKFETPNIADFSMQSILNQVETAICNVMRVPACIAGIQSGLDASTYSNYQTANKVFFEQAVLPMATRIEAAINETLDPSFKILLVVPEDTATAGPDVVGNQAAADSVGFIGGAARKSSKGVQ